ncbi:lipopolysaccharide heptosyltransferase II [Candidatus Protochlamydia phocaeensis]|uniref:lipopolysaccharide heptosyltransferase II n=1 Tax=Candidatus Protochlamydia phocaeensis TaxID=1414722 RepID=UPI000837F535|nr:lipopolysaccharide heptosyltransferase II [Candidatus Protochlamydia phocaeensis]
MAPLKSFFSFPPHNIIVRMPNWLGDLVMATPVLADLRRHWPETKITAMCQGALGSVLQEDPHLDEILNFKRPSGWLHRQEHGDILTPLQQGHYDLGILLTNSLSSAWWFWRGHVQNRIGYATHWRSWLLDYPIPLPPELDRQHLVLTYKKLLEPLGIPLSSTSPKLYITKQEQLSIQEWLAKYNVQKDDILIGINPGAAYGSAKCWLPDRFKSLSQKLLENPHIKILFFGDKAGAPLVNDICLDLPERAINLAGKTTLRELMAFIQACHIFLTNDSGPMHIASALGVPLLALFGSTSDVATGPYQGGKVLHKRVPCSPCYRRECPIDFRCMTRIEVQEVYEELQQLIYGHSARE